MKAVEKEIFLRLLEKEITSGLNYTICGEQTAEPKMKMWVSKMQRREIQLNMDNHSLKPCNPSKTQVHWFSFRVYCRKMANIHIPNIVPRLRSELGETFFRFVETRVEGAEDGVENPV